VLVSHGNYFLQAAYYCSIDSGFGFVFGLKSVNLFEITFATNRRAIKDKAWISLLTTKPWIQAARVEIDQLVDYSSLKCFALIFLLYPRPLVDKLIHSLKLQLAPTFPLPIP